MTQFEYKTVKWFAHEPLQSQINLLAELGNDGWQVFHLHEMMLADIDQDRRVPGMLIYASRAIDEDIDPISLDRENFHLKRKLVAAFLLAGHPTNLKFLEEQAASVALGVHECPNSPIGVCAYDETEDQSHDDCVFCHYPHERK